MRTFFTTLLLFLATAIGSAGAATFDRDHGDWATLLARHMHWNAAGTTSTVDYAGLARDRDRLFDATLTGSEAGLALALVVINGISPVFDTIDGVRWLCGQRGVLGRPATSLDTRSCL